jgi:hypothetical protein
MLTNNFGSAKFFVEETRRYTLLLQNPFPRFQYF